MMRYLNKSIESCRAALKETSPLISDCPAMAKAGVNAWFVMG